MSDPQNSKAPRKTDSIGQIPTCDPPAWISTEDLEEELFGATLTDTAAGKREEDFRFLDAYMAETGRVESDCEYRRALLRLLSILRPQVAHLLGGPSMSL